MINKIPDRHIVSLSIVVAGVIVAGGLILDREVAIKGARTKPQSIISEEVTPRDGVLLPVVWGDLGRQMVQNETIDEDKMRAIYTERKLNDDFETLLTGDSKDKLVINAENAGLLLNLFWGLGLSSKNKILEEGEMMDPKYGGAENFASTGGWTISRGGAMRHFSVHSYFDLTVEQQELVEGVSRGIYRPCCGNSTHIPDCNHGMAMLGLLELMASQGATEDEMWNAALAVNSYWFPDHYRTIATYLGEKSIVWKDVDPREVLGYNYSSAEGYARISAALANKRNPQGSSGCSI